VRELLLRRGHQVFDPVLHTSPRASPRLRAAAKAATATTAGPHVATQQDDAQLSVLLNIVKNGLQGNAPSANIGIIGAGVAGLVSRAAPADCVPDHLAVLTLWCCRAAGRCD
jgi:hypothetical protein